MKRNLNRGFNVLLIFLFILLASGNFFAQEINSIVINSSQVDRLISVSNPVLPEKILPLYEYRSYVLVDWAIPASSLKNIVSDNVTVYVKATISMSDGSGSSVYFKDAEKKLNVSYVVLTCHLEDSMCSPSSELQKNVTFFVFLEPYQNISATISFTASMSPFEDFIPIYEESVLLKTELERLVSNLNVFNESLNNSINDLIKDSQEHISAFHTEEVKSDIRALEKITGKGDSLFQFISAFNAMLSSFLSVFDSISEILYGLAFSLALIAFIISFIFKIRKGGKVAIIFVAVLIMALSVVRIVRAEYLIFADLVVLLFLLAIISVRKPSSKGAFRSQDNYLE